MGRRTNRSEAEMSAQLDALDPESPRFRVLSAARQFKACWVDLGERLTEVRESNAFTQWGYTSFEAYCRRELHIKQDTANKLTRSFAFLRDHEPNVLEKRDSRDLPPLDVVDLLSQAKERTKVSDDAFDTIREQLFDPEAKPPTKNDVMKKFREVDPEAFRPAAKPAESKAQGGDNDLRKALLLAERLESLLQAQGDGVSKEALQNARNVVTELRERFSQTRRQGAA
jgi:hypothetical protein